MAGGSREPGRSVTSKTLAILATFESGRRGLSLTEIAEAAELPISTTHRLVGELEEWGALTRDGKQRYQIGLRLWELAQHAGRALRDTVRPYLQDLYALTGETVHLAIRDGLDVLYIDRVYGLQRVPRASRVGGRLPMHATGVGKAILAYETEEVREAYLRRGLEARTPRTITDPETLRAELRRVRAVGYSITVDEVRAGSCSVAVPVFHTGRIGAGLGLVLHSAQAAQASAHVPMLRSVSERIERATAMIPLESLLRSGLDAANRPRRRDERREEEPGAGRGDGGIPEVVSTE